MAITGIDYFIVILYLCGMLLIGFYFKRFVNTSSDYFLAGKALPFWAIGMSIVATDIGAVDFVGLGGQAYRYGIVVANFDWLGSVPAMILSALVFIPYYWRAGIYTIPEYLGRRYNIFVRTLHAGVWLIFMVFNLGIMLWATGILLSELMGWPIMIAIIVTGIVVGLYTIMGGLTAVVYTDVLQMIIMFLGGIVILIVGFWQLGGWNALVSTIHNMGPEYANHFKLIVSPKLDTPYPWTGILFGLGVVLAPAYFIANQSIVQRCLGAQDEWHAKAGMLLGTLFKLFIPLFFVFPGLIALGLYPGIADGDRAFPTLIKNLLPPGLTGLVFAAFFAGLMSSVDSTINATATIFTKDIYEKFIKPGETDQHYLHVGRILTFVLIVFAIITAPVSKYFPGIYVYIQTMLSIFQGPTLGILILGMFWKRATPWAGLAGLIGGITISGILYLLKDQLFTISNPFLYISWWSFLGSLLITFVVSLYTTPQPLEKLRGLVYGLVLQDDQLQKTLRKNISEE